MAKNIAKSTGIQDLDNLLGGGLFIGDNVIFEVEVGTFYSLFPANFMNSSLHDGCNVIYVSFNTSPASLLKKFSKFEFDMKKLTVIDCFTEGKGGGEDIFQRFYKQKKQPGNIIKMDLPHNPDYFHRTFDSIAKQKGYYTRYVFDSVTGMQGTWGSEAEVQEFYMHTCPMLFDMKTIAYWILEKHVHSATFRANLEHIGQVVIDLHRTDVDLFLRVKKAVERYGKNTYIERKYEVKGSKIVFV